MASAGISWMNAAVLSWKRGIAGTPSQRMTAAARSRASVFWSLNVPEAAYTSIIGMVSSPWFFGLCLALRAAVRVVISGPGDCRGSGLDQLDDIVRVRHHRNVAGRDFDGRRAHALGEHALSIRGNRLVVGGDEIPR